jgi:two-component system sensor histidine kinase UhpB
MIAAPVTNQQGMREEGRILERYPSGEVKKLLRRSRWRNDHQEPEAAGHMLIGESWHVSAHALVVLAVLLLFLAGGSRVPLLHAEPALAWTGALLLSILLVHLVWARWSGGVPSWFPYVAAACQGIVVGFHTLLLMAPAEPLVTAYVLLIFLALQGLRLSPSLVAFTGAAYALELLGLGLYLTLDGGSRAALIDVRPMAGLAQSWLLWLGMIGLRPLVVLVVTACLWYLVHTVRELFRLQAEAFREREETLSEWTLELERRVEQRTAQLRQAVAQQAGLAERERISHALHDGLAKSVAGLALHLTALADRARRDGSPVAGEAAAAAAVAREIAQDARNTLADIRAPLGRSDRLSDILRAEAQTFYGRTGIAVTVTVEGEEGPIPGSVARALRSIVEESLENIKRHSGAGRAEVTLAYGGGVVALAIDDEGRGLPRSLTWEQLYTSRHFGLVGLRERCRKLAGECRVVTRGRLGGAAIRVTIPLGAVSPEAADELPELGAPEPPPRRLGTIRRVSERLSGGRL